MAAFAQLAAVCRGSNTCVYNIAIFTMCESTEQRNVKLACTTNNNLGKLLPKQENEQI